MFKIHYYTTSIRVINIKQNDANGVEITQDLHHTTKNNKPHAQDFIQINLYESKMKFRFSFSNHNLHKTSQNSRKTLQALGVWKQYTKVECSGCVIVWCICNVPGRLLTVVGKFIRMMYTNMYVCSLRHRQQANGQNGIQTVSNSLACDMLCIECCMIHTKHVRIVTHVCYVCGQLYCNITAL